MPIETSSLLVILGMAVVTYATRAGGLWLANRLTMSKRVENGMRHMPGAVLSALIAPSLLTGRATEPVAALVTVLVVLRTGSLLVAMLAGIAVVGSTRFLMN